MDTRLTPKGLSAFKIMAKVIGITAAISVGMNEIAAAARSLAAWCHSPTVVAPARLTAAAPVYYTPSVQYQPPVTFQFQRRPVLPAAPVAVRPFEPVYTVEPFHLHPPEQNGITWYVYGSPWVRPNTGYPCYQMFRYRPYPGYQQRYFTSMFPARRQSLSRHR